MYTETSLCTKTQTLSLLLDLDTVADPGGGGVRGFKPPLQRLFFVFLLVSI